MKDGALKLKGRPTLTRGQHKSGRKLYVEMTFALVMAGGTVEGAVGNRDVTDRVLSERKAAAASNLSASPQSPASLTALQKPSLMSSAGPCSLPRPHFRPHDPRALDHRLHLAEGDVARQIFHAAVRRDDDVLGLA